jgi:hypothetical protein
MHLMSFQKLSLLFASLVLASCSGLPAKNYDARKNNAKQYDFDSSQCELAIAQQYGSPLTTPANYFRSCMKAQGWHF